MSDPASTLTSEPGSGRVLEFGTSGLRGLARDMTDREVWLTTRGFLRWLRQRAELLEDEPGAVAVGEDLRDIDPSTGESSTPRIGRAVVQAIRDEGLEVIHAGHVPTPALALFGLRGLGRAIPAIMVTGGHVAADRNGLELFRPGGEVLEHEHDDILDTVDELRSELEVEVARRFDAKGSLREPPVTPSFDVWPTELYRSRYLVPFANRRPLEGMRVLVFEHSAVGRDILIDVLEQLGCAVRSVGRSEAFVALDTETIGPEDEARLAALVEAERVDALLSTDADGDRPLVVDDSGRFRRGDVLGLLCAEMLGATLAVVPISSSDAIDVQLARSRVELIKTKVGSPFVVAAMNEAIEAGARGVVGWEPNGGFLIADALSLEPLGGEGVLEPLPVRDAMLPMLVMLLAARREALSPSELFARLPQRATRSGYIDELPRWRSERLLERLLPEDQRLRSLSFAGDRVVACWFDGRSEARGLDDKTCTQWRALRDRIVRTFAPLRLHELIELDRLDGLRMRFATGEVLHLRPSGNAPQLRVYAIADEQRRADELIEACVRKGGLLDRSLSGLG